MIDLKSGTIQFDDGLSIDAHSPLSRLQEMPAMKVAPSSPGFTRMSIGTHSAQGEIWGVGAVFVQSKLSQVWLQCLSTAELDSAVWSLDNEKLRKITHDVVVNKLCFASCKAELTTSSLVYKFPWGKISSELDIRGVQALIVVEYY